MHLIGWTLCGSAAGCFIVFGRVDGGDCVCLASFYWNRLCMVEVCEWVLVFVSLKGLDVLCGMLTIVFLFLLQHFRMEDR